MITYNPIYPSRKMAFVAVEDISFSENSLQTKINQEVNINIVITPVNATNQNISLTYTPDDDSIEIISERRHISFIPSKAGIYTITGTATDGTNISDELILTVTEE